MTTTNMETEIIKIKNKKARENFLQGVQYAETRINELLKGLADDGIPVPSDIKTINSEWLVNFVTNSKREYFSKQTGFVPTALKERDERIFDHLLIHSSTCAEIANILLQNPFKVKMTENGFQFDKKEIEREAKKVSENVLDEETAQYYGILNGIAQAFSDAEKWEKEHGFTSFANPESIRLREVFENNDGKLAVNDEAFVNLMNYGLLGKDRLKA